MRETLVNPVTLGPTLVAVHMTGDYLLQSKRMAAKKLTDAVVRLGHVTVYTLVYALAAGLYSIDGWRWVASVVWIYMTHFLTDSKRWRTDNPWPAMPILQDQSLHAVQLAVAAVILVG